MQDLTKGSVTKHMLRFAAFMAVTMLFQTLYFLADLYWVGRLGKEAIAAVGLAGNLTFVVLALTQMLGVGTTTLVSHAAGRKDAAQVNHVFNQSFVLSMLVGLAFGVVAFLLRLEYVNKIASDPLTAQRGLEYLTWFIPALFLQFGGVAIGSALRGSGIIKPTMIIQLLTVVLNIVLAPVLIFGWGWGGHGMGVAGAAIASVISIGLGLVLLIGYIIKGNSGIAFDPRKWTPDLNTWWGMSKVGLPAGGEFLLISCYMTLVYWIIRNFGAASQAGFGIGARIMQAMFLPVIAIAFAASPIAGQNFGAGIGERVRESFRSSATIASAVMVLLTVLCHINPEGMIRLFSKDPGVVAFGSQYLRIISWNFLASGLAFTTSSIFQGIGNTLPPLLSSFSRFFLFAVPAYVMSTMPGFQIRQVWYLSVATVLIQAIVNLLLLKREFRLKLNFAAGEGVPQTELAAITVMAE